MIIIFIILFLSFFVVSTSLAGCDREAVGKAGLALQNLDTASRIGEEGQRDAQFVPLQYGKQLPYPKNLDRRGQRQMCRKTIDPDGFKFKVPKNHTKKDRARDREGYRCFFCIKVFFLRGAFKQHLERHKRQEWRRVREEYARLLKQSSVYEAVYPKKLFR